MTNFLYTEKEYLEYLGNHESNLTVWQCPLCQEWQLDCPTALEIIAVREIEETLELHIVTCKGGYYGKTARIIREHLKVLHERIQYTYYAPIPKAGYQRKQDKDDRRLQ